MDLQNSSEFLSLREKSEENNISMEKSIEKMIAEQESKIANMSENLQKIDKLIQEFDLKIEGITPPPISTSIDDLSSPTDEYDADLFPDPEDYENGVHRILYPDSDKIRWLFKVEEKKIVGEIINFYPFEQEPIKRRSIFENGLLNGPDLHYDLDGTVRMEIFYKDDIENGLTRLYRHGIIAMEVEMIDGKIGPIMKNYHENGKIGSIIRYQNEKRNGIMEIFNEQGQKLGDTSYKNDLKHGPEIFYYADGKIQSSCDYENDLKEGYENSYYPSGVLMQTEKFSKGISITHARLYDTEGRLMDVD